MADKKEKKEEKKEEVILDEEIQVEDPKILRPVDLPLVVKPPKGKKWANEAQERYAQTLNGYAYANTEKWEVKKDGLIAKLKKLEKNPELLNLYTGNSDVGAKISFTDKEMEAKLKGNTLGA